MQQNRGRLSVAILLALSLVGLLIGGPGPVARAAGRVQPTAVAYAPDGRTVAIGSAAGPVFIQDARSGLVLRTLTGHGRAPVTALEFSPDGKLLASGGRDSTVRLWATGNGAEVRVLRGQEQAVRTLAFTPDGVQLLVGGEDTRTLLWNVGSGTLARVFPGASDFVTAVAVSRDGTSAVADRAGRITLRSPAGQLIGTLRGHAGEITDVAFAPDGVTLASSSTDRTVRLWDVAARRQRQSLTGNTDTVTAVAYSPDGATVTSGGRDGSVRSWDARSGAPGRVVTDSRDPVVGLAISPDGGSVLEARSTGTVRTRDAATGRSVQTFAVAEDLNVPARTQAFRAQATDPELSAGPGGPVLVITSAADPSSLYYAEILRAEGLTSFATADVGTVTAATLAQQDVVLLAARPVNAALVTLLTDWVTAGGNLVAMRPDPQLAGLLGLSPASGTLSEGYLLVDTATRPGSGIVGQTIQFHGTADRYTLSGARAVATLYSNAITATANPAVSLRSVGTQGGQAAAFTYDLARSVQLTRQGNPAWAGKERDGVSPIRSDDQFFGAAAGDAQADWVDLSKVAIPQADEQQRLLVNLVLEMNADRTPLPRFWYLPRGQKAAIVMTGDDHGNGGTKGRFDQLLAASAPGCSVADWECLRGTSYIYPNTPLTNAQAAAYANQGFEVGVHVSSNCQDWTADSLTADYARDLQAFAAKYTGVPAPRTNRTHCIAWSEWSTQAAVERNNNIRLDTNYYYWPPSWNQDRAGMFTGSGFPMRFTDPAGQMIDVYQAASQLTDESGQTYPVSVDTLLDRALGPEGYYGAFTINAHTDVAEIPESTTTIASAKARGVPVVSAAQMLTWLDGRNASSFQNLQWSGGQLSFTVAPGAGARNLDMLVPARSGSNALVSVTRDGVPVTFNTQTIKGNEYAFVRADAGAYVATYAADTTAPVVTSVTPADGATGVRQSDAVTATFSEALDPDTVTSSTFGLRGPGDTVVPTAVSYDPGTRTVRLVPDAALAPNTLYQATIRGGVAEPTVRDGAGNPLAADRVWSFTTAAGPACPCSLWPATSAPVNKVEQDPNPVELGVKFRSDVAGFITGVRFWKGTQNTGAHVGSLWTTTGQRLANATFSNETASGWQEVTFQTPVAVTANTTYVASYHTTSGMYAGDNGFFNNGVDTPPLHAPSSSASGGNGVYAYANTPTFPNSTWQATNYWVDAVFTTSTGADTTAPQVLTVAPADGATGVAANTEITASFTEALDPATVSNATATLTAPGGTSVPANVSYQAGTTNVVLQPAAALAPQTAYTVRLAGGTSTPRIKDIAGNALAADRTWTFTTGGASPCDVTGGIVAENCPPGSLTATAGAGGVNLDWGDVTGATGYHVYRATSDAGPFTRVTGPASLASAWVDTLAPAGNSVYRVTAVNAAGAESPPSATASAGMTKPILLVNPSFEIDANADGRPDSWTSSARFTKTPQASRSGAFGGRHRATNNVGYTIAQTVQGITAGSSYALAGSVRVPATTDSFSVAFRVQWLDNRSRVIRTDTVGTVNAATNGWVPIAGTMTAPAGATRATVQMVATSLNATVDVDDLVLR